MLSRDILAIDLDPRHWKNLTRLFPETENFTRPTLYVFVEDGLCVKALHNKRGPILGVNFEIERDDIEQLRIAHDVERVAIVPLDAIDDFMHEWQSAFSMDADWDAQILDIVACIFGAAQNRVIWHPPIKRWPKIPRLPHEKTIGWIWPDETCVGLFVFDGRVPHASMILGKSGDKIGLMTTLDAFGLSDGPFDWRGQRQAVAELCSRSFTPLHAALWIDLGSWREMLAGPRPISYLRLAQKRGRAMVWPRPGLWAVGLWAARVFRRL